MVVVRNQKIVAAMMMARRGGNLRPRRYGRRSAASSVDGASGVARCGWRGDCMRLGGRCHLGVREIGYVSRIDFRLAQYLMNNERINEINDCKTFNNIFKKMKNKL